MADPNHERHAEMVEWRSPDFDPETVDEAVIHNQLTRLGRRSRRKPKAPSPKPIICNRWQTG
jgi:hypothetical protein